MDGYKQTFIHLIKNETHNTQMLNQHFVYVKKSIVILYIFFHLQSLIQWPIPCKISSTDLSPSLVWLYIVAIINLCIPQLGVPLLAWLRKFN